MARGIGGGAVVMREQRTIARELAGRALSIAVDVTLWCGVQMISRPPVRWLVSLALRVMQ